MSTRRANTACDPPTAGGLASAHLLSPRRRRRPGGAFTLIAARVVAGAGAAFIMPGTLSTITSVFPPEGRARAVGVWAGFAGAGGTLGLLMSGVLVDHFYWGSVFVVSGALAAIGIGARVLAIIEGPDRGPGADVPPIDLDQDEIDEIGGLDGGSVVGAGATA